MSINQPPMKRRRVSSNFIPPVSPPDVLFTSPKPSRISTCISCHRTIGLKSSPFVCARCSASTCVICVRACTGNPILRSRCWAGSLSPPSDSSPLSRSITNASSPCRRRLRDEDNDTTLKTKEAESGCGQVVCRMCCFEDPQSGIIACLDCSAKQHHLQSDASIYEPLNLDRNLTAST
ncbi:hypothetical protein BGW80DRAFT_1275629 [Lactifluus volemus]|nr:hypothetical protein BGW80DRAFT_1275629 [Lactifluus volemus]